MDVKLPKAELVKNTLLSRGLPGDLFRVAPFSLPKYVQIIRSESKGSKPIRIAKDTQVAWANELHGALSENTAQPSITVISGVPNDGRAKLLAAYLMAASVRQRLLRPQAGREHPLWHQLDGTYSDTMRTGKHNPRLLVLSGLTADSTPVKVEKCRDVLEKYNDIPRIVVVAGTDGITFANTRLYVQVNYCIHIGQAVSVSI